MVGSGLQSYKTGAEAVHLVVTAVCLDVNSDPLPLPSFGATFTFGTTDVSAVSGTPFG